MKYFLFLHLVSFSNETKYMNELKEYVADFTQGDFLGIKKQLLQNFLFLARQKLSEYKLTQEQIKTFLELKEVKKTMMVCVLGLFSYCSEYSKKGRIIVLNEWYLDDLEDQGLYFLIRKYQQKLQNSDREA